MRMLIQNPGDRFSCSTKFTAKVTDSCNYYFRKTLSEEYKRFLSNFIELHEVQLYD